MEKHPDYWKVKATFFESKAVALEARQAMTQADAKYGAVLRAAGLDPAVAYRLDDETESITVPEPKKDEKKEPK